MKKLIAILLLVPLLTLGQAERRGFTELNIGVTDFGFPGASILWGQTFEFPKNKVVEYQLGIALPTFGTAKFAAGLGNLKNNIMLAVRPWPFFIGPQVKIGVISLSAEFGTDDLISADAAAIYTIGFRWQFKKKRKNVH